MPLENPSGVIYGLIVVGALLAAESGRHESYLDTVALGTDRGGPVLARPRLLRRARTAPGQRRAAHGARPGARARARLGADPRRRDPAARARARGLLGATQETAVSVGLWSAVASLVGLELMAASRSRARPAELALELGVGLAMGIAILFLKIVLH